MIRVALTALLLLVITASARADPFWLVIIASDPSPTAMAPQARSLSARYPGGFLLQTSDCGHADTVFAWVTEVRRSAEAARAALAEVRETAPDAYVRPCEVKSGTLLALNVDAVDRSVAELPETVSGWETLNLVSSAHPLPDGRTIVVERSLAADADGFPPVLRESVSLDALDGPLPVPLLDHCMEPGGFAVQDERLALQCSREWINGEAHHDVFVFDGEGKNLATIGRCRDPRFSGRHVIACEGETVRVDGALELRTRHISLPE